MPQPDASTPGATDRHWCVALTLCAAVLGTFRLGDKGLWYDEVASLGFALRGPAQWVADHNMALYYTLLGGWVRAFGRSEVALRSLSALCFTASVPLFYQLSRALLGVRVARIAAPLFLVHATLVHFAQEARGYMLALLLVIASSLGLWRLFVRPQFRWAVAYAVL